jgi:hypothetical protein
MQPYVQLLAATPTPMSVDEGRSPGVYDGVVAFEVLHLPFARRRKLVWNPMMSGPLYEAYDRQLHWIASLHVPGSEMRDPPAFELRFIGGREPGVVEVFLLVRASGPGGDEARARALGLAEVVAALAPVDDVLRPLATAEAFERTGLSEGWATGECEDVIEVRRVERWLAPEAAGAQGPLFYAVQAWEWHLLGMEGVWCALGRLGRPIALCVSLAPMVWDVGDYAAYESLRAMQQVCQFTATEARDAAAALDLYTCLLYRTARPFTMRVTLVGAGVPEALANAVGAALTLPSLQLASPPTVTPAYVAVRPADATELAIARYNFEHVRQLTWGEDLAALPLRRWRYAVDARQAHTAFRLPVLPEDGYPGVTIATEV